MPDLISRAAALDAIDYERMLLIERKQYGAEHVVVHNARRLIEEQPAVDAIPVEWLNDRIYDMKRAPLYRRYAEMLLMEWLQEQKEQEAQDG